MNINFTVFVTVTLPLPFAKRPHSLLRLTVHVALSLLCRSESIVSLRPSERKTCDRWCFVRDRKGYRWLRELSKRLLFGSDLVVYSSAAAVAGPLRNPVAFVRTLGELLLGDLSVVGEEDRVVGEEDRVVLRLDGVSTEFEFTLGDDAAPVVVIDFARLICSASLRSAFLTGSPASRVGIVREGGLVSISIMSFAACRRKSSVVTFGNGIVCGMNVTMSHTLSLLVLVK